ncbi:unnamed protein product, partial [Arabidopsis halleri]
SFQSSLSPWTSSQQRATLDAVACEQAWCNGHWRLKATTARLMVLGLKEWS